MNELMLKVKEAEVLVFATPIYYYEMSGMMKTFLDRCNPLYGKEDNKFKEVYLIATCADTDRSALDRAINGIEGWISCFDGCSFKKAIYGVGINDANGASKNVEVMQEAYLLGAKI